MIFRSLFISLVLFSSFSAYSQQYSLPHKVDLQDFEGKTIKTSEILLNTKYTLIDFWNLGCKPCIVQLKGFSDHKSELDSLDTRVIAISRSAWNQKEADYMTDLGIEVYFDGSHKFYRKHNKPFQASIPLTAVYDINGDKIFTKTGAPVRLKTIDLNDPDYNQRVQDAMINNPSLLDVDLAYYNKILE